MYLSQAKHQILAVLRHGPLDPYQIGADTQLAPFTVRAELKGLKRLGLVNDELGPRAIHWRLTSKGELVAWAGYQLPLDDAQGMQ